MDEPNALPPDPSAPSSPEARTPFYQTILTGPHGPRAGWRLLIFFAIVRALFAASAELSQLLRHHRPTLGAVLTPEVVLVGETFRFAVVLLAGAIMAKFEQRTVGDYGLPWHQAFRGHFWQGAAVGFAGISGLLGAMRAAGVFRIDSIALHGSAALKYALLWGLVFLAVALFEEFGFRGYAVFTLTTGIGFWPAALASSLVFGYVHHGNHGETWLGAFNAGLVGLLFCLMLRRTGNLWLPIGFHAAWDWGESYFYGVPDSGELVTGHLMNVSFSGPQWLTGGTVGPEGSWLCTALLVVLGLILLAWLREVKYPGVEAVEPAMSSS
jgi:membrane protease YdiL (CAAX protease family)